MTKKDRIMALHKQGKTTREIAEKVYRLQANASPEERDRKMAYIRVVTRQRSDSGQSPSDIRYRRSPNGHAKQRSARQRREAQPDFYKHKYQLELRRRALAESATSV